MIDFEELKIHKLIQLKRSLNKNLFYHDVYHTPDVIGCAELLAEKEGVEGEDLVLLKTGALYHDTGFLDNYRNNERLGAMRAMLELPDYGYTQEEIMIVSELILSTALPQHPQTKLEKILCDADLANLGRDDFYIKTEQLRRELSAMGERKVSPRQWYNYTLKFLQNHQYWTESAKKLWQPKKEDHIREIKELLGQK